MSEPSSQEWRRARARRPVWPTVIGIICIVYGSLDALRFCACGTIEPWLLNGPFDPSAAWTPGHGAKILAMGQLARIMLLLNTLAGVAGLALVAGGIGLLTRKQWGALLCRGWIIVKVVFVLGASVMQVLVIRAEIDGLPTDPHPRLDAPEAVQIGVVLACFGLAFGLWWRLVLPVILYECFSRRDVKEEIVRWAGEGLCPACGYDLRGQPAAGRGCPECGWNRPADAEAAR